ncbi:MAG: hypothetical protein HOD49_15155 [Anaerolineae bacterium]|nr:hypothetical protein [Anaerolineae bacterium]
MGITHLIDKDNIKFRTVVPIFNIWSTDFKTEGEWSGVRYKIQFIELTRKGIELNSLVDQALAKEIYRHVFMESLFDIRGKDNCQILVIDIIQPLTEKLEVASNSIELLLIEQAITLALFLSTNIGILKKNSYTIRLAKNTHEASQALSNSYSVSKPHSYPNSFFHSGRGVSIIKDNTSCEHIFKSLLQRDPQSEIQAQKLLNLGLDYFTTTFSLRNVEHSFLILMIVFEALFKEDESQNTHKVAKILASLIAVDREERKSIQKAFTNNPDGFIDIRHSIAHGSLINLKIIKEQYQTLYKYIVRALIKIIDFISENKIKDDYYKTLRNLTLENGYVQKSV